MLAGKLDVSKDSQVVVIRDIYYERERNWLKTPEQLTSVLFIHVVLFRIHERGTRARPNS